ncbi:glycosyltransferase [Endozoicomonas elysicola]|uniref:Group 1 glycosyl transferase n=1 Tax=Endozoicomonas elysicola TaxID=305900 RepID=A0A081KCS3_9GAMM|nr:glycosyltransferase [Endozoicomonas elysicola]KEI71949.1 group 1 glycosyl transferase [Endozoicomonas elysicola]
MNILQVNKFYYPVMGGVETVCKQHSEFLAKKHSVTILCVQEKFSLFTQLEIINNVKVYRCSSLGTFFSMPVSLSFVFYYIRLFLKSDLVFFHLPFPMADFVFFLTRFIKRRTKIFAVWHSDIVKQGFLKRLLKPLLNSSVYNVDKIIVTSPKLVSYSEFLKPYMLKDKIVVLPLSVNVDDVNVSANNYKGKLLGTLDNIDGCFFGRLCYYKGVDVLMDALLLAKKDGFEPRIVIAGEGEYSSLISDKIKEYSLDNVIFINRFLDSDEKYWLLQKSKCFLFPSVERSEAFGITQIESMSLGTPVINTNLPSGVPWVSIHRQTGFTVDPKNPLQLYLALKEMLVNESERLSYGRAAIRRVKKDFDDHIVLKKLEFLVEGVSVDSV